MRYGSSTLLVAAALAAIPAFAEVGALKDSALGATFSTLVTTPFAIEGLTNDDTFLYTPGRALNAGDPCPVWRTPINSAGLTVVGFVPAPSATGSCSPSGLAFGPDGQLYVTQTDRIYRFTPNATTPPTGTVFASGVPGTNGLAFDWNGNLWTGDGTTGQGRVWKITPSGTVTEMFRVQPMANEVNLVNGTGGIGRDVRSMGPGTITVTATSRNAANTLGSQPLVANGVIFSGRSMFIADTARGALWRVRMSSDGTPLTHTGCDSTFTANTLCLDHVWVQHPALEGADGIVADVNGNIWVDANERNAVAFVFRWSGQVVEVFRNSADSVTQLRNLGPLETPTSPILLGHKFCTANSDGNRRDNFPSSAGEIGGTGQPKGKISCLDQFVTIPGGPLPVR